MDKPRKWKARSSKVGGWTKEMWIQQREWVSTNKKRVVEPIWADCSDLTGRLHVHSKRTAGLLTGIAQFASISWRFQCCGSLESRQNKAKNVLHKQSSTEKRCGPFPIFCTLRRMAQPSDGTWSRSTSLATRSGPTERQRRFCDCRLAEYCGSWQLRHAAAFPEWCDGEDSGKSPQNDSWLLT